MKRALKAAIVTALLHTPAFASGEEDCLNGGASAAVEGCTRALETATDRSKRNIYLWRRVIATAELYSLGEKPASALVAVEQDIFAMFSLFSRNFLAVVARGRLNHIRDRDQSAEKDFNSAIEMEPTHPIPLMYRGRFYVETGRLEKARADFENVLRLKPGSAPAYVGLAQVAKANRDDPSALQFLEKALTLDPKSALAYYERGDLYLKQRDAAKAIADFDRAISIVPGAIRSERGKKRALALVAQQGRNPPAPSLPAAPSPGPAGGPQKDLSPQSPAHPSQFAPQEDTGAAIGEFETPK